MKHKRGFTLIEMAMVLVIMALLVGSLLPPLVTRKEAADRQGAKEVLEQIKEALIGYYLVNRRLPCPASGSSFGGEDPTAPADGICSSQHGFVPSQTLGFSGRINEDGLLLDPWNNPYRYSVSNSDRTPTAPNAACDTDNDSIWEYTTAGAISSSSPPAGVPINCLNNNLGICDDGTNAATCGSSRLTNTAPDAVPAVIFSMGKNWAQTSVVSSAHELENVGTTVTGSVTGLSYLIPNDMQFVSRKYYSADETATVAQRTRRFDDIVTWISPNVLYNKMISTGIYP
ncbi:MAG: prepilin-type N-terminal cleavage/methylation domain-containing protein [Gammaproteobacteria bacterium]|nr:prepilin-type N-terminal cleavage/methylation domain-containing protein [Gammaproteobacteria bacterium]